MALPPRWTKLRSHPVQHAYWTSPHRFNTVPAGRRSGKTEIAKRKTVKRGLRATTSWPARFFLGAPTRDQAKRIFWDDLKALIPPDSILGRPWESDLMVEAINGTQWWVVGLDKPQRIEGQPWDGGVLDEFANMKSTAWSANVRPALSDRLGWCDLIGVPEGRNHYYDLDEQARALMAEFGAASEWGSFHWISAEILPAAEIAAAKRDLDPQTYEQEYEASFLNFSGRAYYPFLARTHAAAPLAYDPRGLLIFCFDFNVEPGVAAILQEQPLPGQFGKGPDGLPLLDRPIIGTGVIGEVWIPHNSTTPAVCRKLIADWGAHKGRVICYGDASGGARGSAKVDGSDWDLIKRELRPTFGDRVSYKVKPSNPEERARVNAVNTRLQNVAGEIRLMVDPKKAPHVVKDFEGVKLLKGGSGEIEKVRPGSSTTTPTNGVRGSDLTHLTDGIGYYVEYEFPVKDQSMLKIVIGGV